MADVDQAFQDAYDKENHPGAEEGGGAGAMGFVTAADSKVK